MNALVFWCAVIGGSALYWGSHGAGMALLIFAGFMVFCAAFDI